MSKTSETSANQSAARRPRHTGRAPGMHRRDLRRDRRPDDAETDSRALQHCRRRRTAAGPDRGRFRSPAEKRTRNFARNRKRPPGSFPAKRCATKSGTASPNPFSIIKASSMMRPATRAWRSASTRLIANAAPAAIAFSISRSRRISSNRS